MANLSPAANAVWEAFNQDEDWGFMDYGEMLAAALRAVARQIIEEVDPVEVILRIAAELEGADA